MTEQIERELTDMFHERAAQLDVLPPLPAARVRRARLQTGLAMASVVAVLTAGGVVGVRLASGTAGRDASVASSGSAQSALEQVAQRMLAGRWHISVKTHGPDDATSEPAPRFDVEADFDGPRKIGIARQDGKVLMIEADGVTYTALQAFPKEVARYLPPGARWQRTNAEALVRDPIAMVIGLPGTAVAGSDGSGIQQRRPGGLGGETVRRTATGFRVETRGERQVSHADVTLRADGTIASVHVAVDLLPAAGSSATAPETSVTDVVFTPLTGPLEVSVPDPATVITDAQMRAAFQKAFTASSVGRQPCSGSVPTPTPTVSEHRTANGGSVTLTQTMPAVGCGVVVAVPPHPGKRATLAPTPSPR